MKKIYAILTAALCLSVGAKAQRLVDLGITTSSPAANTTIEAGTAFNISAVVTNVGSTTLKASDTVVFYYAVDNNLITYQNGGNTYYLTNTRINQQMAPGDTIQLNRTMTLNFSSTFNGTHNFCVLVRPYNTSADSVKDNVLTNNSGCNSVTLDSGSSSTGINTITATEARNEVTNVFPNPATSNVNVEMNLYTSSDVTVRVLDLMGRTVMTTENRRYGKGKQSISLNTTGLNNGLYLYQVVMGENISSGKLYISK